MKTKILSILGAFLLALMFIVQATPSLAATPEEIEAAIEKGLEWLAAQQNADGSWGPGGDDGCNEKVAYTGLAVLKFNTNAIDLELDPLSPDYEYSEVVQKGLDYIMSKKLEQAIGIKPTGDPDGDGDGKGVYWSYRCDDGWGGFWEYHQIYNTSIAMMGIASSGHPELYGDVLQDAVDYMAWAQVNPDCGVHRGGWRYAPGECTSDNSNTGYATLGLGYAQALPPYGFNLTVPQFVKDELSIWIGAIQNPVDGDPNDGGSYYDPSWPDWENILKTGNLIYEMALVGDTTETGRVQDAIDYIERHWNNADSCGAGWLNHRQAMFMMMKGFESLGIELIDLDGDGVAEHDWYDEVSTHLVETQNPDGSWPWDCWGDQILSTTWAYLTLARAVPEVNQPPDTSQAYASPNCLWPPNHKMVPVSILGVTDPEGDPVTITITSITSDEPTASDKGSGGAKHAPDASGIGSDTATIRAERSGNGDGRVYVINFTASDVKGRESTGSVVVKVPHDQSSKECLAIDSGQNYDATQKN